MYNSPPNLSTSTLSSTSTNPPPAFPRNCPEDLIATPRPSLDSRESLQANPVPLRASRGKGIYTIEQRPVPRHNEEERGAELQCDTSRCGPFPSNNPPASMLHLESVGSDHARNERSLSISETSRSSTPDLTSDSDADESMSLADITEAATVLKQQGDNLRAESKVAETAGEHATKNSKLAEATVCYTAAIRLTPHDLRLYANRALCLVALRRLEEAIDDLKVAVQAFPEGPFWFLLVHSCTSLGRLSEAVEAAVGALNRDARAPPLARTLEVVQKLFEEYEKYRATGHDVWAKRALQDACGEFLHWNMCPPIDWIVIMTQYAIQDRDWAGALRWIKTQRVELSASGLEMQARVLFLVDNLTEAGNRLERAFRLDPHRKSLQILRARLDKVLECRAEAEASKQEEFKEDIIAKFFAALESVGSSPEEGLGGPLRMNLLLAYAEILAKAESYTEALLTVTEALDLDPKSYKPILTRARIFMAQKDFEAACHAYASASRICYDQRLFEEEREVEEERSNAECELRKARFGPDHYMTLGVDKKATTGDITRAYRKLALKQHPDKGGCEEQFKKLAAAYEVLSCSKKRQKYDASLKFGNHPRFGYMNKFR